MHQKCRPSWILIQTILPIRYNSYQLTEYNKMFPVNYLRQVILIAFKIIILLQEKHLDLKN